MIMLNELLPRAVTDKLINQRDNDGNTPLHAAAEEGHIEAFEKLLEYGKGQQEANKEAKPLDWSVRNKDGNTPLHVALLRCNFEVAEWLVKQQPKVAGVTNNDGNTPLHVAAEVDAAGFFKVLRDDNVQWQPTWRVKNKEGNTPLHVAIINYNWNEIPKLLLDQDSELARVINNLMETPLHLAIIKLSTCGLQNTEDNKIQGSSRIILEPDLENAAKNGDVGSVKEIRNREIENGNYFLGQNSRGDNILQIAFRFEQYEIIEQVTKWLLPTSIIDKLIDQKNSNGDTLYHIAGEVGKSRILELLLEFDKYGMCDDKNSDGNLPVHVALFHGHLGMCFELYKCSIKKRYEDLNLIEMLVRKDSSVACWHDEGGLTPLHRAISLNILNYVKAIKLILEYCPESAKEVDINFGKTILHFLIDRVSTYQQGKDLLQIQDIYRLKDVKDNQGNTPLDLACKFNFKMARLLLDSTSHIQQLTYYDQMTKKEKRTLEEYGVIDGVNIHFLRRKISKFGINFLSSRDSNRRNVLHNLMRLKRRTPVAYDECVDFIWRVIDSYPILLGQTDINGDTPFHILMQNSYDTKIHCRTSESLNHDKDHVTYTILAKSSLSFMILEQCSYYFNLAKDLDGAMANVSVNVSGYIGKTKQGDRQFRYDDPWLVQNVQGNTPIHEALKANTKFPIIVVILMEVGTTAYGLTNKRNETPLHLLVGSSKEEWPHYVIKNVHDNNVEAALIQDQDGLTPILRAVQVGHIQTVKIMDDLNNEASKIIDNNGQTLWHMLVNQPSSKMEEFVNDIGNKQHLIDLLKIQNKEGKTSLHLALESRRFTHAFLILKCSYDKWLPAEKLNWTKELLNIKDGDGITSGDRLASIPDLPQDLENLLMNENPVEMMGYRSVYGISTEEMKDYVNTMGVIAALLTTITYTAAFTVPGGAVQDDKDVKDKHAVGTPLLVKSIAFQAFMFFDILTMCLSTMVLFCLLWIFATGSKRKSVILMDFSILLLLISFYTTLVSFMAGVYATTIHVKPWIAIYTLVMCLSLMLLKQKYLVVKFLGPVGPIVTSAARKYFRYLRDLKLCKKVKDIVCHASNAFARIVPTLHRD